MRLYNPETLELERQKAINNALLYRLKMRTAQVRYNLDDLASGAEKQAIALQIKAWECIALGYENEALVLEQGKNNLKAIHQEYFV